MAYQTLASFATFNRFVDEMSSAFDRAIDLYFPQCEFETPESSRGACDAISCNERAAGSDLETRQARCSSHLQRRGK